jgi:hypothetical protein
MITQFNVQTGELVILDEDAPSFPIIAEAPNPKLVGVEFQGVMCSATGNDQNGLMAVFTAIQVQGAAFPATRFEFDNGNELIITTANYQDFMAVWRPFRQSFYLAAP